jgi:hypothetical protein
VDKDKLGLNWGHPLAGPIAGAESHAKASLQSGTLARGEVAYSFGGVGVATFGGGVRGDFSFWSNGSFGGGTAASAGGALGAGIQFCRQKVSESC